MKVDFTKVETIYSKAILVQPILEIPNPGIMISSFTDRKFYLPLDMHAFSFSHRLLREDLKYLYCLAILVLYNPWPKDQEFYKFGRGLHGH